MNTIAERYNNILNEMRIATRKAGRISGSVKLVVVTKGHPADKVQEVIDAGAEDLGENYVQEALAKMETIGEASSTHSIWHMIGHVQSRKAALVVDHFDWVHSVDSLKLAHRLDRFAADSGRRPSVLLEYNVSGEGAKFGWDARFPSNWPEVAGEVHEIVSLNNISVRGLMAMAPFGADPEEARPYFAALRQLAEYLAAQFGGDFFSELSMGMSQDYKVAIEEGATMIRVGQAIMGPRHQSPRRE